jgi:hypothetical protein
LCPPLPLALLPPLPDARPPLPACMPLAPEAPPLPDEPALALESSSPPLESEHAASQISEQAIARTCNEAVPPIAPSAIRVRQPQGG